MLLKNSTHRIAQSFARNAIPRGFGFHAIEKMARTQSCQILTHTPAHTATSFRNLLNAFAVCLGTMSASNTYVGVFASDSKCLAGVDRVRVCATSALVELLRTFLSNDNTARRNVCWHPHCAAIGTAP